MIQSFVTVWRRSASSPSHRNAQNGRRSADRRLRRPTRQVEYGINRVQEIVSGTFLYSLLLLPLLPRQDPAYGVRLRYLDYLSTSVEHST